MRYGACQILTLTVQYGEYMLITNESEERAPGRNVHGSAKKIVLHIIQIPLCRLLERVAEN